MKININYSKNNLAERILFLFLKEKKIADMGIMDYKSLTDYYLNKIDIDLFENKVNKINFTSDEIKQLVFPIQNKTNETSEIIKFIEDKIDNAKFKDFEKKYLYTKNLIRKVEDRKSVV